jgi:hypothetical protein
MEKELHYPLFYRRDLNLANIVILSGICLFVFNIPDRIVFGRILPGLGVSLLVGLSFYVYLARRLARKEQRNDVTALPYGISTPVMFVYLFGIIGPVYWNLKAAGNPDASIIAWQVGGRCSGCFSGGHYRNAGKHFRSLVKKGHAAGRNAGNFSRNRHCLDRDGAAGENF